MATTSNKLTQTIQVVLSVVDKTKGFFTKVSTNLKKVETGSESAKKGLKNLENQSTQTGKSTAKLSNSFSTLLTKIKGALSGFTKFRVSLTKTKVQLRELGSSAKKAAREVGGVVGSIAALVSILAAVVFPVASAATFEQKMSQVQAITGATGDTFDRLTEKAEDMGEKTAFTASQAADGLRFLAMAGLSADQAIRALEPSLNLAKVGHISLGEAADFATNIMGGMKLGVEDLDRIIDVMAKTSTSANTNIVELAEALSYAAPAAAAVGVSVEQAAAAIGIMANAGIKASRAGTGLRAVLSRLSSSQAVQKMRDIVAEISYTAYGAIDLIGTMKSLGDANITLKDANDIFGRIAATSALVLATMTDDLQDLIDANYSAAGSAKEMAKVMTTNLIGTLVKLKSALSSVAITAGNVLIPAFTNVGNSITKVVQQFSAFLKRHPQITKAFVTLTASVALLTGAVVALSLAIGALTFKPFIAGIGLLKGLGSIIFTTVGLLAGLATLLVGILSSENIRKWFENIQIGSKTVKEAITNLAAVMVKLGTSIALAFISPRKVIADLGVMIAEFVRDTHNLLRDTPGIGKLLGIVDSGNEIDNALNSFVQKMEEAREGVDREIGQIIGVWKDADSVQAQIAKDIAQRQKDSHLALTGVLGGQAMEETVRKYSDQLEGLQTAYDKHQQTITNLSGQYTSFRKSIIENVEALSKQADFLATDIWEGLGNTDSIRNVENAISAVNTAVFSSAEAKANKLKELDSQLATERISTARRALRDIESIYDEEQRQRISLLEASLNDEEDIAEQRVAIEKETFDKKKQYYEKAQQVLATELQKSLRAEEALANRIIALQDKLLSSRTKYANTIRSLERKGMTEREQFRDEQKEINELIIKGQTLAARGSVEAQQKAQEYFDRASTLAEGLAREVKDGDKVYKTLNQGISSAKDKLKQVQIEREKSIQNEIRLSKNQKEEQAKATEAIRYQYEALGNTVDRLTDKLEKGISLSFDSNIEEIAQQFKNLEAVKVKFELEEDAANSVFEQLLSLKRQVEEESLQARLEVWIDRGYSQDDLNNFLSLKDSISGDAQVSVSVEGTEEASEDLGVVLADLKEIEGHYQSQLTVAVNNQDVQEVERLSELLLTIQDKRATIDANTTHTSKWEIAKQLYDSLKDKTVVITQHTKTVGKFAAGGSPGDVFSRPSSPMVNRGSGLRDDVPALLKKKEFVLRSEAVRALIRDYGLGFLYKLNRGIVGPIANTVRGFNLGGMASAINPQRFADGGMVESTVRDVVDVNLRLPTSKTPIRMQADRANVGVLLRELKAMNRLS